MTDEKVAQHTDQPEKDSPFSLSRSGWLCLLVLDAMLFISFTFGGGGIYVGVAAFILAVVIGLRGSDIILAPYNERRERLQQGAAVAHLTTEQKREIVAELRRQRAEKREAKRAARRERQAR